MKDEQENLTANLTSPIFFNPEACRTTSELNPLLVNDHYQKLQLKRQYMDHKHPKVRTHREPYLVTQYAFMRFSIGFITDNPNSFQDAQMQNTNDRSP